MKTYTKISKLCEDCGAKLDCDKNLVNIPHNPNECIRNLQDRLDSLEEDIRDIKEILEAD